ncbi:hypothetical protein B0H13DRAFT_2283588 [Mycena leptocephala]|nr:hypothetical protein B0H13DRAFT_2283588 [Mycena leptocephala]
MIMINIYAVKLIAYGHSISSPDTMSLSITEFPQDLLLELAKRLDVADLLSFLSLCRISRELQFERTLWLDALIRIRKVEMQPLPMSPADSVDTLSPTELQNIRQFSVEATGTIIFFIPGANLIVAYTIKGSVSCWDTLTSQRVAHLNNELEFFNSALCTTGIKGKALIGVALSGGSLRLAVICIDFRDRAHISISHVISPPSRHLFKHLFINPQVMGFCTTTDIVTWSMNADAALQTTPGAFIQAIPSQRRVPCLAFGQTLYLFFAHPTTFNPTVWSLPFFLRSVQRIPSDHPGPNPT